MRTKAFIFKLLPYFDKLSNRLKKLKSSQPKGWSGV